MYTSMFRKAMLGDTATLNLDFTTGVLDSRLTFTRAAGTATYINSSGYVTTAAANVARFDYDPVTLAPRGLLIEGTAINLLKNSAYADTNWIAFGGYTKSITTGITSPANDTTAARLTFTAVGHGLYTNNTQMAYTNTVGATYTMSAWIRATSNTTNLNIRFGDSAVATGPNIPITTTWTRYSYSYVALSASGPLVQSASGTATGEFEMWGFQLELGSGASSYIPTGASQVTRNGDSCVMTGTNFSSWFAGATEGVLFAQYEKPRSQSGNAAHDFSAVGSRYTTGAGFILYAGNSNYYPTTILWPTGGAIFGGGIATAIPSVTKQAGKWFGGNDVTNYSNGVVGTTVAGTGTLTPAMLSFGANSATGTEATRDWLNSCIRQVKFYPTALSDAAIQTLTTT